MIHFRIPKSDLGNAIVSGSDVQIDQENYDRFIDSIRTEQINTHQALRILIGERDSLNSLFYAILDKRYQLEQDWVIDHPEPLVSYRIIEYHLKHWSITDILKVLRSIDRFEMNSRLKEKLEHHLELRSITDNAPDNTNIDFSLPDTTGAEYLISDLRDKFTLIEFWASWCAPCRKANPDLKKIYDEYNSLGFEIVGVSLDKERNRWKDAIIQDELPWHQLSDLKGFNSEPAIIYNIGAIPNNIFNRINYWT